MCVHFSRGHCTRENCPYTHMDSLSDDASVCPDFAVLGWCDNGSKCKNLHVNECPDFNRTGTCPRGTSCKMPHFRRARKAIATKEETNSKAPKPTTKQHFNISEILGSLENPESSKNTESLPHLERQDEHENVEKTEENRDKEKDQNATEQNATEQIGNFFDNASTSGGDGNDDFIKLE